MSAWIVSKGLIDCLVQAGIVEGLVTVAEADAFGQMLWHENHLSIEARYGDEPNTPTYKFTGVEAPLDDGIVYSQVRCYDYQTCEHAGYEASDAHRFVQALSERLEARRGTDEMPDEAPWGIEDIHEAIAQPADV